VASPGRDLLITAAHCISSGKGGSYREGIVFIPDYRDGQAPFGTWTPARMVVAPQWASSSDPNLDVGFVVLKPHDGENIQQVLGANHLGTDSGYWYLVRVTGYPASGSAPVTCVDPTSRQSASQLRFDCGGYTGGTSGSPWVTDFDPLTRTGTIVGVIGGYQQGGDTPSISYSPYLGDAVQRLYRQAVADEPVAAG
jgi:V8-like Glu-specific endopeptidase